MLPKILRTEQNTESENFQREIFLITKTKANIVFFSTVSPENNLHRGGKKKLENKNKA